MITGNLVVLHLSLINGIGPVTIMHIVENVLKEYELLDVIYSFTRAQWLMLGISEKRTNIVMNGLRDIDILHAEIMRANHHNVSWTTCVDAQYPAKLRHIFTSPPVIYWQGAMVWETHKWSIALVGSRAADEYGKRVVEIFVPSFVASGWAIISGGAYGIDTCAHEITVRHGGVTIVVLGSGLLDPYPKCNSALFKRVTDMGGVVLSTFNLLAKPHPGNFPERNRIIAALAIGTVVIQAAEGSGSLITARYALEQGSIVGAVPGPIDSLLSFGSHELLREGAFLATDSYSIMRECGFDQEIDVSKFAIASQKNICVLSQDDQLVIACETPCTIEFLMEKFNMSIMDIQEKLFQLQIDGLLTQNFLGLWQKI